MPCSLSLESLGGRRLDALRSLARFGGACVDLDLDLDLERRRLGIAFYPLKIAALALDLSSENARCMDLPYDVELYVLSATR